MCSCEYPLIQKQESYTQTKKKIVGCLLLSYFNLLTSDDIRDPPQIDCNPFRACDRIDTNQGNWWTDAEEPFTIRWWIDGEASGIEWITGTSGHLSKNKMFHEINTGFKTVGITSTYGPSNYTNKKGNEPN